MLFHCHWMNEGTHILKCRPVDCITVIAAIRGRLPLLTQSGAASSPSPSLRHSIPAATAAVRHWLARRRAPSGQFSPRAPRP